MPRITKLQALSLLMQFETLAVTLESEANYRQTLADTDDSQGHQRGAAWGLQKSADAIRRILDQAKDMP